MNRETIQASLGALRGSGSVFGVMFAREAEVLFTDVPYSRDRVDHVVGVMDDICFYFLKENRSVDQLAFGYDGGSITVVIDDSYRLIVLHSLPAEVDYIAKAGKAFLVDYQMGIFATEFEREPDLSKAMAAVNPLPQGSPADQGTVQEPYRPATQRIALKAEAGFDDTEPIQPMLNPVPAAASAPSRPRARQG